MNCQHCHRESRICTCQASLLPELPAWREELQQRLESYRARRGTLSPAALPDAPPPALRVVAFTPPPPKPPAVPIADPVVMPRRNQAGSLALAPFPIELPALDREPAFSPAPQPEFSLAPVCADSLAHPAAEPLAEPIRDRRGRAGFDRPAPRRCLPTPAAAYLQIPLPMAPQPGSERRPAPVASRRRRLEAAITDAGIVAAAALLFALAAWAAQGAPAPTLVTARQMLPALVLVPGVLAALYWLLCAYTADTTPGLRRAGLRLFTLEGGPLTPIARRRRAWASLVSLAALGLGFAWILCDSQSLTWHDYISGTCVGELSSNPE